MSTTIRYEEPQDVNDIRQVNELAFGRPGEADVVDTLRDSGELIISLVAEKRGLVVGHILFSPVTIKSAVGKSVALALGPMAVLPAFQRQGIGSLLVRAGLVECQKAGHDLVIVLGHPDFYPRFGFVPSRPLGIRWEKEVPEEVFMVAELRPGGLTRTKGIVKYHPAFDGV